MSLLSRRNLGIRDGLLGADSEGRWGSGTGVGGGERAANPYHLRHDEGGAHAGSWFREASESWRWAWSARSRSRGVAGSGSGRGGSVQSSAGTFAGRLGPLRTLPVE